MSHAQGVPRMASTVPRHPCRPSLHQTGSGTNMAWLAWQGSMVKLASEHI